MKKHMFLISNIIIIIAVMAGFTIVTFKDTKSYQNLSEKHLENVVSLVDTDISNRIDSFMSKPVMVSKTMANDEFLKTWLLKEPKHNKDKAYMYQLNNYLKAYQLKYGYSSVFCISAKTGRYYYQNGFNKVVSTKDPHDIWYYNFTSSKLEYDLEVDTNQANHNTVTVFVNFRVMGDNGKLLGVIGVGLEASFLEKTIYSYEKDYNISIYIINVGGVANSFKGKTDIFVNKNKLPEYTGINEKISMNKSGDSRIQWFNSGGDRKCLITKYESTLGWYLVLKMQTNSMYSEFQERIKNNIIFMLFSLLSCIFVTTMVFKNYNKRIVANENVDDLTGISNRKLFTKQYREFNKKYRNKRKMLFMLDIDNFKKINDVYGHMFGNEVLAVVAGKLKTSVGSKGIVARWGGDEFIGILSVDYIEAQKILSKCMEMLKHDVTNFDCRITLSVGLMEVDEKLGIDEIVKKADELMYTSKRSGRDKITIA